MSFIRTKVHFYVCGCLCATRWFQSDSKPRLLALSLGLITALLLGCNTTPRYEAPADPEDTPATFEEPALGRNFNALVQYAQWLRNESPEQLDRIYQNANQQYSYDTMGQLHLALLLSLPNTSFADDQRAESLLTDVLLNEPAGSDVAAFAHTLLWNVNDRRNLQHALTAERAQRELGEKKIEKIKAIEQQINQREATETSVKQ